MKKYRPSNGTEGEGFMDKFCAHCIHGKYEHTGDTRDNPCEIACNSMAFDLNDPEYPSEWTFDEQGKPICTAHVPWDWNKDDDGNWNDPPPRPFDDPNQLVMPFILDELDLKSDLVKEGIAVLKEK